MNLWSHRFSQNIVRIWISALYCATHELNYDGISTSRNWIHMWCHNVGRLFLFLSIQQLLCQVSSDKRSDKTESRLSRCRFSQKTNEPIFFFFFAFHWKQNKFVRSFVLGESTARPNCFRFYLTFREHCFYGLIKMLFHRARIV